MLAAESLKQQLLWGEGVINLQNHSWWIKLVALVLALVTALLTKKW